MDDNFNQNPHRRFNILTGEWILVSPHRTKRPWQGKVEKLVAAARPSYDKNCYLCPTNQRSSGEKNPDYKEPYAFVNDYSALLANTPSKTQENGLLQASAEKGVCKVICFSPNHALTLPLMPVKDIAAVVSLWKSEYETLGKLAYINHVQIFENKGAVMGCSNPHPHGQIWAQESVPMEAAKKSVNFKKHWQAKGSNLLLDYLEQELELKERIIIENDHFVALVPYWAVWPFETMIIPKVPTRNLAELAQERVVAFAEVIKNLTIRYDNLFETSFPYSAGIHQAPTDGAAHEEWQMHMSFYPPLLRSATVKKFMVGYEMFADPQRDITAEQAATRLKDVSDTHYSVS